MPLAEIEGAEALLAHWFRFQPSELDALTTTELVSLARRAAMEGNTSELPVRQ